MTASRWATRRLGGARRAAPALALALLAASLSGCASAPVDTWDLGVPEIASTPKGRALQALVPEPVTDRAYDSERLLVRPSATEIAYYGGAQWSDRLPRLVQSRLVEALEHSGRFRAAGRPGQGLAVDRQVIVEIRAFDYLPAAHRVDVALAVKLMDDRSGRVLATAEHSESEPVSADTARAVVDAFDAAFGRVATAVVADAAR